MTPHECNGVVSVRHGRMHVMEDQEGDDGAGGVPTVCVEYLSVQDALKDADSEVDGAGLRRVQADSRSPRSDHGSGFNSHKSWKVWRDAVNGVDEEALAAISESARKIVERVVGEASNRVEWVPARTPCGTLDVPAYLAGLPEVWNEPVLRPTIGSGRNIELVINGSASSMVDVSVMRARAIAALALAAAIEAAGGACEIWYGNSVTSPGRSFEATPTGTEEVYDVKGWSSRILFKPASAPLDLAPIASWCASADGLRRGMFALCEHFRNGMEVFRGTYGMPAPMPDHWRGAVKELSEAAHGYEPQWQSEESTLTWIEERLRGLGVIK